MTIIESYAMWPNGTESGRELQHEVCLKHNRNLILFWYNVLLCSLLAIVTGCRFVDRSISTERCPVWSIKSKPLSLWPNCASNIKRFSKFFHYIQGIGKLKTLTVKNPITSKMYSKMLSFLG